MSAHFERFVEDSEPLLRRALLGLVGVQRLADAVAEALAYAWENWDRISVMDNPVGYLVRVGQSKTRTPRHPQLPHIPATYLPEIEPGLPEALMSLPESQRAAVWLAHGCGWAHSDIAALLGVTRSTVSTHVNRGLAGLRYRLGAISDA